jgi:Protein of unknown function DUF84
MQNSEAPTPPSPVLLLRVAVGSKNPVKINAVRQALEQVLEASSRRQSQQEQDEQHQETRVELQIESFDVPSGVSTQPVGDVSARVFHPASIVVVLIFFLTHNRSFPPIRDPHLPQNTEQIHSTHKHTTARNTTRSHQPSPFRLRSVLSAGSSSFDTKSPTRFGHWIGGGCRGMVLVLPSHKFRSRQQQ